VSDDASHADSVTQSGTNLPYTVLRDDIEGVEIRNGGYGSVLVFDGKAVILFGKNGA
jgi:hypothetical protein